MKFSEALRAGRLKLEPGSVDLLNKQCTKGCALGMALVGAGVPADEIRTINERLLIDDFPGYRKAKELWPWLKKTTDYGDYVYELIYGKWDTDVMRKRTMTEEQFFTWVEKLEEQNA